jgi:UPF0755 protein
VNRSTVLRLAVAGVAMFAVTLTLVAGWAYGELHRPYAGWSGDHVDIVVEPGLDAGTMLGQLAEAGILRRPGLTRTWLSWTGEAHRLHAGEYSFDAPLTPLEVLRRLREGEVVLHEVTLPEGLNLVEIARRLEEGGFGTFAELHAAFSDPSPVADLDAEASDLEGYLYPETYRFPRGERASRIAEVMVRQFREAVGEGFTARASEVGLTVREAVTLASMIEKETSLPGERARIAGVFHNRLARRMKLECDPTVLYSLHRAGREVETLTYDDLRVESPWNTYVIQGLPAGPIANPGVESLNASLEPLSTDELFFVAAPGGGHSFSADLGSHLKAVAEWRRYARSSR